MHDTLNKNGKLTAWTEAHIEIKEDEAKDNNSAMSAVDASGNIGDEHLRKVNMDKAGLRVINRHTKKFFTIARSDGVSKLWLSPEEQDSIDMCVTRVELVKHYEWSDAVKQDLCWCIQLSNVSME